MCTAVITAGGHTYLILNLGLWSPIPLSLNFPQYSDFVTFCRRLVIDVTKWLFLQSGFIFSSCITKSNKKDNLYPCTVSFLDDYMLKIDFLKMKYQLKEEQGDILTVCWWGNSQTTKQKTPRSRFTIFRS